MMNGNGQSRLNAGETFLIIGEDTLVLRPTSRAWSMISRQYQGLAKARQAIIDENIDAIVFIIRVGTAMSDRDARNLDDRVWRNGITVDLLVPLIKYIAILNNGGRPLAEDIENVFSDMPSANAIEDYSTKND